MLGKTEGRRRRGRQRMRWLNGIIDSTEENLSKLWKIVKDREAWHAAVYGVVKSRTQLSNGMMAKIYPQRERRVGKSKAEDRPETMRKPLSLFDRSLSTE